MNCSIRRIRAEDVETAVTRHIAKILHDGKYLDSIAKKIVLESEEVGSSSRKVHKLIQKELQETEREMEAAFKFQLGANKGSEGTKFFLTKIEDLGKRKTELEKQLLETKSVESNVISLAEARKDLEDRFDVIARGWSKMSPVLQKRALSRIIQRLNVGPNGIDVFYYSNALTSGVTSGVFFEGKKSTAKVLPLRARGIIKSGSKLMSETCLSARMVTPGRVALPTYSLGNRCSICLSYGVTAKNSDRDIDKRKELDDMPQEGNRSHAHFDKFARVGEAALGTHVVGVARDFFKTRARTLVGKSLHGTLRREAKDCHHERD